MSTTLMRWKRPIYLTGVPRCGSSWVGEVLSTTRRVRYIYEPFNPTRHPFLTRHHVYLAADDDDAQIRRAADAAFRGRIRLHNFLRGVKRGYAWQTVRPADRVLVKDPTGMFLADWIASRYQAHVLIIVRHPCAFASSIHRLGWPAKVQEFLDQPRLMADWLAPYEKLLRDSLDDFWCRVAAFWGAAYTVLHGQLKDHPDWRLLQYEDLCSDPECEYARLFADLGLEVTSKTRRFLTSSSTTADSDPKSTRRDSRSMRDVWRKRLTEEQVKTVTRIVRQFDLPYYR
jgi:hypothetical protein